MAVNQVQVLSRIQMKPRLCRVENQERGNAGYIQSIIDLSSCKALSISFFITACGGEYGTATV